MSPDPTDTIGSRQPSVGRRDHPPDLFGHDVGTVDLDDVTGVVDRHQLGVVRQRRPVLLSCSTALVELFLDGAVDPS